MHSEPGLGQQLKSHPHCCQSSYYPSGKTYFKNFLFFCFHLCFSHSVGMTSAADFLETLQIMYFLDIRWGYCPGVGFILPWPGWLFWLFIILGISPLPLIFCIFCILLIMELHRSIIWFICCIFWFICIGVGVACTWVRVTPDVDGFTDWSWLRAMVDFVTWSWLCAIAGGTAVKPNIARPATAPLMIVLLRVIIITFNPQLVSYR